MTKRPGMLSSFTVALKKATTITEDVAEAKREHRSNLKILTDQYMQRVQEGKAEGIRNAKDLVEIIKADLLLMGEANERTDNGSNVDEVRVTKIMNNLDLEDESIQSIRDQMYALLNKSNDDEEDTPDIEQVENVSSTIAEQEE